MKHYLLTLPIAILSATAATAQTTPESAITAQQGSNTYTVEGETSKTVYWKFTADKNYLASVGTLNGSYNSPSVGTTFTTNADSQEQEVVAMRGASLGNGASYAYPLVKGNTYYFTLKTVGETGFTLSLEENDNIGGGLDASNPAVISLDKTTFIGNANSTDYNYYNTYATYTATEDAQLVLSSPAYMSATVDGTQYASEYADGKNNLRLGVESGKTYSIAFNIYQPFVVTASLAHPTKGSLEMPFEATEGDNTVPADYGEYYYTFTPSKTGYLNLTSQSELLGGNVTIYSGKANVQYKNPSAKSEDGSYNVRMEVPYTGTTYYIYVNKPNGTDNDESFNIAMEEYKQGEKEDNPIEIGDMAADVTLPSAAGTYYYAVKVPANTTDLLTVKAKNGVASGTSLNVYPQGNAYSGVYGTDYVELNVNNQYESTYIIKWIANETEPLTFNVAYKTVQKGDLITNPADAVSGENTVSGDGTKYYAYTATRTGKLSVELTEPTMSVTFPRGTDSWSGTYTAIQNGITYSIEATEGTRYLITLANCTDGAKFNITETDFAQGEVGSNPINVSGDSYTLSAGQSNVWLKYTAKKACLLVMDYDKENETDDNTNVEYGNDPTRMSGMISTIMDGSSSVNKYHGTTVLAEGGYVLVHITSKASVDGKQITFAEEALPQGLTVDNPLTVEAGETINVETYSGQTLWIKAELTPGTNTFTTNAANRTRIYFSLDDAATEQNGEDVNYDTFYDPDNNYQLTATYKKDVTEAQTAYFQIVGATYGFNFTFASKGTTGINAVENASDAATEVFTMNGVKVADSAKGLEKGIYIVRQNGKASKIIIK